ncbi:MAG: TraR/DksA family transcriptional regulator [bacterium]
MSLGTEQLEQLRTELNNRLNTLEKNVHARVTGVNAAGEPERGGTDRGDESNRELERDLELTNADRETYEIQLVQGAIQRIEQNEFGICLDCSEEINESRLLANPIAKRCLDCQTKHENDFDQRDSTPSL